MAKDVTTSPVYVPMDVTMVGKAQNVTEVNIQYQRFDLFWTICDFYFKIGNFL